MSDHVDLRWGIGANDVDLGYAGDLSQRVLEPGELSVATGDRVDALRDVHDLLPAISIV